MLAAERRIKILDLLKANQVITVSELCEHFETSEATIRRDLSLLDAEGKLERTHGGALFTENKTTIEDKVKSREAMAIHEKASIALVAFNLLEEHDSIILDAGTTTLELAKLIGQSKLHLSVITNSTIAFKELSENPNLDMIMLGGKVRANTLATVGLAADEMLKRFHVDKVFLGTNGITLDAGLTTTDLDEAQIKRSMLSMAKQRIVLLDHSKFNKVYLNQIAPLSMVDVMITDPYSDADQIKAIINAYDIKVLKSEDL
jgi:DeoR family transcriptional regulator, fructose operon transcriptional repressor